MYNRYIPQHDGSFQKHAVQEQRRAPQPQKPVSPVQPQHPPAMVQNSSVDGFLKKLLPKGFDTADLIIVLLLLLMAGDCEEEQNTALLTLALYFFM